MKTPELPVAKAKYKETFSKMKSGQCRTTATVTMPIYAWFCYHGECMISAWNVIVR